MWGRFAKGSYNGKNENGFRPSPERRNFFYRKIKENEAGQGGKRLMRRSLLNKFIACLTVTALVFVSVGTPLVEAYGLSGANASARGAVGLVLSGGKVKPDFAIGRGIERRPPDSFSFRNFIHGTTRIFSFLVETVSVLASNAKSGLNGLDRVRKVNETVTEGAVFDDFGRRTGYVRTTVEGAKTTRETVTGAVYDGHGRLERSVSDILETGQEGGNVLNHSTRVTVLNVYGELGRLCGYEKTVVDGGKQTVERASDLLYDAGGRVAFQRTETTESLTEEWKAQHPGDDYFKVTRVLSATTGYNTLGQGTSWVRMTSDGGPWLVEKTNTSAIFDGSGRLCGTDLSFVETDRAVNVLDVKNGDDLIVLAESLTAENSTDALHRVWSQNSVSVYNGLGQVVGVDKITRAGLTLTRERSGGTWGGPTESFLYDTAGRLVRSVLWKTETNGAGDDGTGVLVAAGAVLNQETRVTLVQSYDGVGRMSGRWQGTQEKESLLNREETLSGLVYDGSGRLSKSLLLLVESAPGYERKTRVATDALGYNALGQVTYLERRTSVLGNGNEVKEETTEVSDGFSYDGEGRQTGLKQWVVQKSFDVLGQAVASSGTYSETAGVVYNALGWVVGQGKTRWEMTTGFETKTINEVRRALADFAVGTGGAPYVTRKDETNPSPTRYDDQGRVMESTVVTRERSADGVTLDRTMEVHSFGLVYNGLGQLLDSQRATTDLGKTTTETTTGALYDGAGRLVFYNVTTRETGSVTERVNGQDVTTELNNVTTGWTFNKAFDAAGRATESVQSTRRGDRETVVTLSGAGYDERGRLISYTRKTLEGLKETEETPLVLTYNEWGQQTESSVRYHETSRDGVNFPLDKTYDIVSTGMVYDGRGRLVGYERLTTHYDDLLVVVRTVRETTLDPLVFNALGLQSQSRLSFIEQSADGILLTKRYTVATDTYGWASNGETAWFTRATNDLSDDGASVLKTTTETTSEGQTYDAEGRLQRSVLTVRDLSVGVGLDHTYQTAVLSTVYNDVGLAESQRRERTDFGKVTLEDISYNGYDDSGRATRVTTRFTETGVDGVLNRSFLVENTSVLNVLGQATRVTTVTREDTAGPERRLVNDRTNVVYNSRGLVTGYSEEQRSNLATSFVTLVSRSGTVYDDAGQAVSWTEVQKQGLLKKDGTLLDGDSVGTLDFSGMSEVVGPLGGALMEMTMGNYLSGGVNTTANDLLRSALSVVLGPMVNDQLELDLGLLDGLVDGVLATMVALPDENGASVWGSTAGELWFSYLSEALNSWLTNRSDSEAEAGPFVPVGSYTIKQMVEALGTNNPFKDKDGVVLTDLTFGQLMAGLLKRAIQAKNQAIDNDSVVLRDLLYGSGDPEDTRSSFMESLQGLFPPEIPDDPSKPEIEQVLVSVLDVPLSRLIELEMATADGSLLAETPLLVLMKELLFKNPAPDVTQRLATEVCGDLSSWVLADGTALAGLTFSDLMKKGLNLPADKTVEESMGVFFSNLLKSYEEKTQTTTVVSGVVYDSLGRSTGREENRVWGEVGGGGIPGLDGDWRNGTATVRYEYTYGTVTTGGVGVQAVVPTDRLWGQTVWVEDGRGTNKDGRTTFSHQYAEAGITYDGQGRQVESTTYVWQPALTYTYYCWTKNYFGDIKDHWRNDVVVKAPGVAVVTKTQTLRFDGMGRPTATVTDFKRDDANFTRGHSGEEGIYYNGNTGVKAGSTQLGGSANVFRGINEGGGSPQSRAGPVLALLMEDFRTDPSGLLGDLASGAVMGLMEAHNHQSHYVEQAQSYDGTNRYVYDLYGNVNQEATRTASDIKTETTKTGGESGTGYTAKVMQVMQVVQIVAMVVPMAAWLSAVIVAVTSAMQAGIQGATFGKAVSVGLAQGAASYAGNKSSDWLAPAKLGKGALAASKAAISATMQVMVAWQGGTRDSASLWQTAGQGALSGALSGELPKDAVLKAVVVATINTAVASLGGVKSGGQLLMVAALSFSISWANTALDKKFNLGKVDGEKKLDFSDYAEALSGAVLSEVLARVIVRVNGPEGQMLASAVAQMVVNTLARDEVTKGSDGLSEIKLKETNYIGDALSMGLKGAISRGEARKQNLAVQTQIRGMNARDVQTVLNNATREQKVKNAYLGSLLDLSSGLAQVFGGRTREILVKSESERLAEAGVKNTAMDHTSESTEKKTLEQERVRADKEVNVDMDRASQSLGANEQGGEMLGVESREGALSRLLGAVEERKLNMIGVEKDLEAGQIITSLSKEDQKVLNIDLSQVEVKGFYVKDLNLQVAVAFNKEGKMELAGFEGADGKNTFYRFDATKTRSDETGVVQFATARVFREINGRVVDTRVDITFATRGTKEFAQAVSALKKMGVNEDVLKKLEQSNVVVTETDESGGLLRQVFGVQDAAGNFLAQVSVHKDGTMRTYNHAPGAGEVWEAGVVTKGNVYEQKGGVYGKEAAAVFEIRKRTGVDMKAGAMKTLVNLLGLGGTTGGALLVYAETAKGVLRKSVLMEEKTGVLRGVVEEVEGKTVVTVFSAQDKKLMEGQAGKFGAGAVVRDFSGMGLKEQNEVMASLPAMGKRDSAAVMTKLMAIQTAMTQAKMEATLMDSFGMEGKDRMLALPEGMAVGLGLKPGTILKVERLKEEADGGIVLEGSLLSEGLETGANFKLMSGAGTTAKSLGLSGKETGLRLLLVETASGYRCVRYAPTATSPTGVTVYGEKALTRGAVDRAMKGLAGVAVEPIATPTRKTPSVPEKVLEKGLENLPLPLKPLFEKLTPYLPKGFTPGLLLKVDSKERTGLLAGIFNEALTAGDNAGATAVAMLGQVLNRVLNALPMSEAMVYVANALEGRDYEVVGGEFKLAGMSSLGVNEKTGREEYVVKEGGTYKDEGGKVWEAGSVFEGGEKGLVLVSGVSYEAGYKGFVSGERVAVVYEGVSGGMKAVGVSGTHLGAGRYGVKSPVRVVGYGTIYAGEMMVGKNKEVSHGVGGLYQGEGERAGVFVVSVGGKAVELGAEIKGNSFEVRVADLTLGDGSKMSVSGVTLTGEVRGGVAVLAKEGVSGRGVMSGVFGKGEGDVVVKGEGNGLVLEGRLQIGRAHF